MHEERKAEGRININCEPQLLEITAKNHETGETTCIYIRNNSTVIEKRKDAELIDFEAFGVDVDLQTFRQMFLNEGPRCRLV